MLKKIFILIVIFGMGTGTTFAFIVSAPAVEAQLAFLNTKTTASDINRKAEFLQTVQKWAQQYIQMREQIGQAREDYQRARQEFDYWKNIKGNWRDVVERVRNAASQEALKNSDFVIIADMAAQELYQDRSTGQNIGATVDRINQYLKDKGYGKEMSNTELRDSITEIVGYVPDSSNSGISAMSQTTIEETAFFLNKANKAIVEISNEKQRIQQILDGNSLNGAPLTEAQTKKYEIAMTNLDQQMQNLNTQALLKISQMLMVESAFRTQSFNKAEQNRIESRNTTAAFSTLIPGAQQNNTPSPTPRR
jgi:hypothetical protein